jgi:hypothetical protein
MKSEDKKEFAGIMVAMGENFNAKITKEGLKIRFEALAEFAIDQVKYACMELIKNRVYPGMPTTGEIRAAMVENRQVSIEDVATVRLNEIMGKIREVGSYGSPKWDDPIVADLLSRRWRWASLCEMTEKEHKWFAKEFVEAYRAAVNSGGGKELIKIDNEKIKGLLAGIGK